MLHYETISPAALELLKSLQSFPDLHDTCLVGGTALALQLGHRKSIDLDIFGSIHTPMSEIRRKLSESHRVQILKESDNISISVNWHSIKEMNASALREFLSGDNR